MTGMGMGKDIGQIRQADWLAHFDICWLLYLLSYAVEARSFQFSHTLTFIIIDALSLIPF
jgi:hypothetical protein